MRIGIPSWDGRVSPVLDTAQRLVVVETEDRGEADRREVRLGRQGVFGQAAAIAGLDLDILICGAVSRPLAEVLEAGGVTIVGWISGKIDEVLEAYARGELEGQGFLMPGCCGREGRGHRRRWSHGGPSGRWRRGT